MIKLGTSSITTNVGLINEDIFSKVVEDISYLRKQGYRIMLVSSGAVGNGKGFLKSYKGTVRERKAAAAVGNPLLIHKYFTAFSQFGIVIAQTLFERWHFSKRNHFLQLRETVETLWENGIIPIANENDVVSDLEIRFSDNDHLATLIAAGFGAKKLLIGSSVEGILDDRNEVISTIFDPEMVMQSFIKDERSALGLGGMQTKVHYASLASRMGIDTTIFGLSQDQPIRKALANEIGSHFPAKMEVKSARSKWLLSGSLSSASIEVDQGAKQAVLNRKSLLAVGVVIVQGSFFEGEIVDLKYKGKTFAVGKAKVASHKIEIGQKVNNMIIVHADHLVVI